MVKGRSDLFLRINIVKKILTVIAIVIALQFGIFGLLYAQLVLSIVIFLVNAYYTNRFIDYSAKSQLYDISPLIFLTFFWGGIIWLLDTNIENLQDILRIVIGSFLGTLGYIGSSYILRFEK